MCVCAKELNERVSFRLPHAGDQSRTPALRLDNRDPYSLSHLIGLLFPTSASVPLPLLLLDHCSRLTFQVCFPYFYSNLMDLFVPVRFPTFPMPSTAPLIGTAFLFPVPCKAYGFAIDCFCPLLYNVFFLCLLQQECVSHDGTRSSNIR